MLTILKTIKSPNEFVEELEKSNEWGECQRCGTKELQSNLISTVLYPNGLCQDCLDD